jgi:cobalt-zinc-cadmium efflux system outer membrane protein
MKSRFVSHCVPHALVITFFLMALLPAWSRSNPVKTADDSRSLSEANVVGLNLSWPDILKLVDAHPRIVVGRQKAAAAIAAVDTARAVANPGFEVTAGHGLARDGSASGIEWGLGLSIPLDWIAQRGPRVEAAVAKARVADAEAKVLRRGVLLQLRALFWNLVYEQERVTALVALDAKMRRLSNAVRRRVLNGESRPVEATRVEIEAQKIAAKLALSRTTLETRRSQLGLWLKAGKNKKLRAVAELAEIPQPLSVKAAQSKARTNHPIMIAAQARIDALFAEVSLERQRRIPGVSIQAFADDELDRLDYGVGLAVTLPLWNQNTGNIRRAEASLAAGISQKNAVRREIESAVFDAQAACQSGVGLALRYRDQIQPRASSVAQTIERTYQLGEATLLELIDARRTLSETRIQFLAALMQAQTACSRLAVLVGEKLL